MNLFWSIIALAIIIAFAIQPRDRVVKPNLNFYYGPAYLIREGMSSLRKVTTNNYPYENATHIPTNWAINKAIDNYHTSMEYNNTIAISNDNLNSDSVKTFNSCN